MHICNHLPDSAIVAGGGDNLALLLAPPGTECRICSAGRCIYVHCAYGLGEEGATLEEAKGRLESLRLYGETPFAFSFKHPFPAPDAQVEKLSPFLEECPS